MTHYAVLIGMTTAASRSTTVPVQRPSQQIMNSPYVKAIASYRNNYFDIILPDFIYIRFQQSGCCRRILTARIASFKWRRSTKLTSEDSCFAHIPIKITTLPEIVGIYVLYAYSDASKRTLFLFFYFL